METQALVDSEFGTERWVTKTIVATARMGFLSADRAIEEYAEAIWNVEPCGPQEAGAD